MALANQFRELQQGRSAVTEDSAPTAASGPDEVLSIWCDHIDRLQYETASTAEEKATTAAQLEAAAGATTQLEAFELPPFV